MLFKAPGHQHLHECTSPSFTPTPAQTSCQKCTLGRLPSICWPLAVADGAQEELGFFAHVVVCARLQDSQQFSTNAHNYM